VTFFFAGGGGYGPVGERCKAAIQQDIDDGFISAQAAAEIYGYSDAQ